MEFQFTIIVPVYNEIESLPRLFEYLQKYLKFASLRSCVLLVDDGSSDGSASAIEKFCLDHDDFNCLLFDKNYGKGAALKPLCLAIWTLIYKHILRILNCYSLILKITVWLPAGVKTERILW